MVTSLVTINVALTGNCKTIVIGRGAVGEADELAMSF